MQTVQQVEVLPKRAGAGYTLLAYLTCPDAKADVYRRRNEWRTNGSTGPARAIGQWAQTVPYTHLTLPKNLRVKNYELSGSLEKTTRDKT